jgi:hypothetical protein
VTGWTELTDPEVAEKLAVEDPAATVTVEGTARALLSSEIATGVLPLTAAVSDTLHVADAPETTVEGEH